MAIHTRLLFVVALTILFACGLGNPADKQAEGSNADSNADADAGGFGGVPEAAGAGGGTAGSGGWQVGGAGGQAGLGGSTTSAPGGNPGGSGAPMGGNSAAGTAGGQGGATSNAVLPLAPGGSWEVDLTSGNPGRNNVEVTGGTWDGGWRVTSSKGDRLVWDMGRAIKSGILEVHITINKSPHSTPGKINYAGLYESSTLNQDLDGDIFYARVGADKYKFSRVKSAGHLFAMNEWEPDVGNVADWKTDDSVNVVKFEWKAGASIFHDNQGRKHVCDDNSCNGTGQYKVDELRYVFVGADKWPRIMTTDPDNISTVGMRFVKLKLTDME